MSRSCLPALPVRTRATVHARAWFAPATFLVAAVTGCDSGGTDRFMSIGTAGTGGVYYILGGALASELTQRDPNRQYTAEVTGGAVENVNRIREGQLDLGMVISVTAYEAYHGGTDYPQPVANLRIVAPLYPNITNVLVGRGFEGNTIAELRGRRVSVGAAGSGTEQLARQILEAAGLTREDVDLQYLTFAESASAIADGAIDAAIMSVGYPAGAVLEATTTGGGRLIPIEEAVMAKLTATYPYHDRAEIPPGVYQGVTEPIPTIGNMNWLVASDDLPAEVVENVLDVLVDRRDALIQVHEMARQIDLDALGNAPIPLHPATEAWLARRRG